MIGNLDGGIFKMIFALAWTNKNEYKITELIRKV